jgi:hypothetical protein
MNRARSLYDDALDLLLKVRRHVPLDPETGARRLLPPHEPFVRKDSAAHARQVLVAQLQWAKHLELQTLAHDGEHPTTPPSGLVCSARLGEVAKLY